MKNSKFNFDEQFSYNTKCYSDQPIEIFKISFLADGTTELLLENEELRARVINFHQPGKYWDITDFQFKKSKRTFTIESYNKLADIDDEFLSEPYMDCKHAMLSFNMEVDELITNRFE